MTKRGGIQVNAAAEWVEITSLVPWERNPVVHTTAEIEELRALISSSVWTDPLVARRSDRRIIAGHRRRLAALEALRLDPAWRLPDAPGVGFVPVRFVEVDDATAARLTIADNAMTKQSAWDDDELVKMLSELEDPHGLGIPDDTVARWLEPEAEIERRPTSERYEVLIGCASEAEQRERLDRLLLDGVDCSAIVFKVAEHKAKSPPPENTVSAGRLAFARSTQVTQSARVKQAAGMFDLPVSHASDEAWDVDVALPDAWNIGLIVGASGSGKSTLAAELFGKPGAGHTWDPARSLLDGFPAGMSITEITEMLTSVGFASPPAWLRPYHVLSTGQQFRVDVARTLAEADQLSVIDEFTSTVDRTVAQIGSAAVARAVRRRGQQLVAVTCHYDVAEWLCPDWIIEMPTGKMTRGSLQRPTIRMEVRRVAYGAWDAFSRHHYLTGEISKSAHCYVGFVAGEPVTFASVIFATGQRSAWRAHRSVCLPDYQGVGIGHALQSFVASLYAAVGNFTMKISSPAVVAHAMRSHDWEMLGQPKRYKRGSGASARGDDSPRYGTSFRWVGAINAEAARAFGLTGGRGAPLRESRDRAPRRRGSG